MKVFYKSPFRRFVKKQNRAFQLAIEDEVERVIENPDIGEAKKGDLSGLRIYKFKFHGQEYLIAYRFENDNVVFYMIGVHEGFYRSLKQYVKEVG